MKIESHTINNTNIAQILSEEIIISSAEDGLDLLGNLYYQGFDKIIIHEQNITPAFFDLKNGIAGEILQKFSNYRVSLAIIGDFSPYQSKSIKDFIYESNRSNSIALVRTVEDALKKIN